MIRKRILFALSLVVFGIAPTARAQTDMATAEMLMRRSGLWEQLTDVPNQVKASFMKAYADKGIKPTPQDQQKLNSSIELAYAPDRLRSRALHTLAQGIAARNVSDLKRWYASPIGVEITKLEETAAADKQDPTKILQDATAMLAKASSARRSLLEQLVSATRSAEAMTTLSIDTALGLQQGASSAPNASASTKTDLKTKLERQRPQLLQAFGQVGLTISARTYASLPDAAISKYVQFLKSPAGAQFTDISIRALDAALVDAANVFGRDMPTINPEPKH
jgi:hypothetical protein